MHKRFIQFTPFIPPDNHLSIPLTLLHSPTLLHPVTPTHTPFLTKPQHSDLAPICFSLDYLRMRTRQPHHLIGLCREILGKPLPPFMFIAKHEYPISSLACMLHQTKTWLNRHFRCVGAFLEIGAPLQTAYQARQTRADKVLDSLETAVWIICKSSRAQVVF